MTDIKRIGLGLLGLGMLAAGVLAAKADTNTIDRTFMYGIGSAQRPGATELLLDYPPISSGVLVNLAMGRDVDVTNMPNQVMALTFACDLSSANLIVYDENLSNTVSTIATSVVVYEADDFTTNGVRFAPYGLTNDLARFVTLLQVENSNSGTNALLGGFLTIAGRLHRNPTSGCPIAVSVTVDKSSYDQTYDLKDVPRSRDPDKVKSTGRIGLANMMGGLEFVQSGVTNNLMLPLANLAIRYGLPVPVP
jgi:hypothetical protein